MAKNSSVKPTKPDQIEVPFGLDGVVAGETYISHVDGQAGKLIYRDQAVEDLVTRKFSEVASLVVCGAIHQDLANVIDQAPPLSQRERDMVLLQSPDRHPMQVLQGLTPLLDSTNTFDFLTAAHLEPMAHGATITDDLLRDARSAIGVAVRLPEVVALHLKRETIGDAQGDDQCARFLSQIDAPANTIAREAFSVMQILQLEHSFNASAFAARVVASTQAPIVNALSGGIGTLHGVLHGGADQAALETADRVGDASNAGAFVDACLANGERVMGMGHREYKVVDPRAKFAKDYAQRVTKGTEHEATFATLEAIETRFSERMAEQGKSLYANIEFYKGVIFRALGLPPAYFTAMFAMARVYGYTAHVLESRLNSRLIRPAARYLGCYTSAP